MKRLYLIALAINLFIASYAQISVNTVIVLSGNRDTSITGKPKSYNEVVTNNALTSIGLFKVHKVTDRYYFEIPDSLLDRDILVVNRIVKGPAAWGLVSDLGKYGFSGDIIGKNMIRFVRGPQNKVFIKSVFIFSKSKDSTNNGLYNSLSMNNLPSITAAFDIKAFSPDNKGVLIDLTDYLSSDNDVFFFESENRNALMLKAMQSDKSYISKVQSFPLNIEIRTIKTYVRREGLFATYELNSSMILLPKEPMKPRYADDRIGYFTTRFADYDADPQHVSLLRMVNRWRMEPKPGDIDKYKNGELVEPKNPIVYYIDPNTPKKWVPYLIQGVNDWQKAFEKAGFKNAIYALEAPTNDPEWSLVDARHNAIVYKPSEVENASGPHVNDPRSGEILETHVNWYHNVMQLLRDWYFIQCAAVDTNARTMHFNDQLMGKLIRYVCSHEIGHTLGLMHNFGSSSTVPVDSLRNKKWVEANGHTPSIMDYARFNYVAQPQDSISELGLFPRIGAYDEWAIEWGYRWFPDFKTEEQEKAYLNQWVVHKLNDKRYWFGSENNIADPRVQSEDLSDDAIMASNYGIMNLKRIMSHLIEWTTEPNEDYSSLKRMYNGVVDQFKTYLFHVTDIVGGSMRTPKTVEQQGPVVDYPSRERQKAAMQFLKEQIFSTPAWILDKEVFALTESGGVFKLIYLQKSVLEKLLSHNVLSNLLWFETNSVKSSYSPQDFFNDLNSMIWSELSHHKPIDIYRRNLQKVFVDQLIIVSSPYKGDNLGYYNFYTANNMTDIVSLLKANMRDLILKINAVLPLYKDEISKDHLVDVRDRLKKALEMK
ncbi:hypothetical protein A3860_35975 [Niastella vici]|uniref:Zinc-dependent metalloprotease n=1 Tax=Niastella vici TaxID=1703345 RepID=A0A1V9FNJ3_9BACT|nr:zinc-dependent metalloprotease [Niastella vici]OQP59912.1 hypothetical protein A3860_35975 [Niastella vici]